MCRGRRVRSTHFSILVKSVDLTLDPSQIPITHNLDFILDYAKIIHHNIEHATKAYNIGFVQLAYEVKKCVTAN